MSAIGAIFLLGLLALNFSDIDDPGMTVQERNKFNSGWFVPHCEYDLETGAVIGSECRDYRKVNHKNHTQRGGLHLMTRDGYFTQPADPDPEGWQATVAKVPDGVRLVVHPTLGSTESTCYFEHKIRGDDPLYYPAGCYNPNYHTIHVTAGDIPTLRHEIRHVHEGAFHE